MHDGRSSVAPERMHRLSKWQRSSGGSGRPRFTSAIVGPIADEAKNRQRRGGPVDGLSERFGEGKPSKKASLYPFMASHMVSGPTFGRPAISRSRAETRPGAQKAIRSALQQLRLLLRRNRVGKRETERALPLSQYVQNQRLLDFVGGRRRTGRFHLLRRRHLLERVAIQPQLQADSPVLVQRMPFGREESGTGRKRLVDRSRRRDEREAATRNDEKGIRIVDVQLRFHRRLHLVVDVRANRLIATTILLPLSMRDVSRSGNFEGANGRRLDRMR